MCPLVGWPSGILPGDCPNVTIRRNLAGYDGY
jgi:hypothetical protein